MGGELSVAEKVLHGQGIENSSLFSGQTSPGGYSNPNTAILSVNQQTNNLIPDNCQHLPQAATLCLNLSSPQPSLSNQPPPPFIPAVLMHPLQEFRQDVKV